MRDKPDWMYRQSAVVPYLRRDDGIHVVLVTSAKSRQWGIPKGIIEPGFSAAESAAREAEEEAGVLGSVEEALICEYSYEKWGGSCRVQVFPLLVKELLTTWDESGFRDRVTVPLASALGMVKPVLVDVLTRFRDYADPSLSAA